MGQPTHNARRESARSSNVARLRLGYKPPFPMTTSCSRARRAPSPRAFRPTRAHRRISTTSPDATAPPRRYSLGPPHNLSVELQVFREFQFKQLASFNKGTVGIFRASAGVSPWERHPDDHESLHVLEDEVEITVIAPEGWTTASVTAGAVLIERRGLWHRHTIRERLV